MTNRRKFVVQWQDSDGKTHVKTFKSENGSLAWAGYIANIYRRHCTHYTYVLTGFEYFPNGEWAIEHKQLIEPMEKGSWKQETLW